MQTRTEREGESLSVPCWTWESSYRWRDLIESYDRNGLNRVNLMRGKLISFCNVGRASFPINITTRELEPLSQFALRNYERRWSHSSEHRACEFPFLRFISIETDQHTGFFFLYFIKEEKEASKEKKNCKSIAPKFQIIEIRHAIYVAA